jgi:hypothetical protein
MRFCEEEGCFNPHRAHGLCSTHYSRLWYEVRGQRGFSEAVPPSADVAAEEKGLPTAVVWTLGIVGSGLAVAVGVWAWPTLKQAFSQRASPATNL